MTTTTLTVSDRLDLIESGQQAPAPEVDVLARCAHDAAEALIAAGEPAGRTRDNVRAMMLGVLRTTPGLWSAVMATPASFVDTMIQIRRLNLDPDPKIGHVHVIARDVDRAGRRPYVDLMIGFRGLLELARRSPDVRRVWSRIVRPTDGFFVAMGTDERIEHTPDLEAQPSDVDNYTHVYAVVQFADGGHDFEVLSRAEVEHIRSRSKAGPVWRNWPTEMARKAAIRRLCKRLPLTREFAAGIAADDRGAPPPDGDGSTTGGAPPVPVPTPPVVAPARRVESAQPPPEAQPGQPSAPAPADDGPAALYWRALEQFTALGAVRVAEALGVPPQPVDMVDAAVAQAVPVGDLFAASHAPTEDDDGLRPGAGDIALDYFAPAATWRDVAHVVGAGGAIDSAAALAEHAREQGVSVDQAWTQAWRAAVAKGRPA